MIIANILISIFLLVVLISMFFIFDYGVLGGVFGRKLKSMAENKFENPCNQNCDQGRNCKCERK